MVAPKLEGFFGRWHRHIKVAVPKLEWNFWFFLSFLLVIWCFIDEIEEQKSDKTKIKQKKFKILEKNAWNSHNWGLEKIFFGRCYKHIKVVAPQIGAIFRSIGATTLLRQEWYLIFCLFFLFFFCLSSHGGTVPWKRKKKRKKNQNLNSMIHNLFGNLKTFFLQKSFNLIFDK